MCLANTDDMSNMSCNNSASGPSNGSVTRGLLCRSWLPHRLSSVDILAALNQQMQCNRRVASPELSRRAVAHWANHLLHNSPFARSVGACKTGAYSWTHPRLQGSFQDHKKTCHAAIFQAQAPIRNKQQLLIGPRVSYIEGETPVNTLYRFPNCSPGWRPLNWKIRRMRASFAQANEQTGQGTHTSHPTAARPTANTPPPMSRLDRVR